jgi:hypothetical protein
VRFTHPGSFKDEHSGLVHFSTARGPAFCDSVGQCKEAYHSNAAYLFQVARSSKGGRYRTFNPLAQVQFGHGAFPKFSQSLLLTNAFEDEDDDDEDGYEMTNAKREVPSENARKRSMEAHR